MDFLSSYSVTIICINFCSSLVSASYHLLQIGGGNLNNKAAALQFLASRCDALVFVGLMSFQIIHALGHSVPTNLVELEAQKAALDIVQFAHNKNVLILYPKDFWCVNQHLPKQLEVLPAQGILDGKIAFNYDIYCLLCFSIFSFWVLFSG